jgi:predicted permease
LRPAPADFASGLQTAFRFNSYIGLALAARLGNGEGLALMALVVGVTVPLCNVVAVWALAKHGEARAARTGPNPLILATATGLATNLLGPSARGGGDDAEPAGFGLHRARADDRRRRAADERGHRHGWPDGVVERREAAGHALFRVAGGEYLPLTPLQYQIVVVYASLPTASSSYILAVRMGGNGPMVAATISAMTVVAIVTTPVWLSLVS